MRKTLLTSIALITVLASPVLAQGYPQVREGFTASFGIGAGSAGISCEGDCDTDRELAPALYIRLGGAYRPNLILGGEINGWTKSEDVDGDDARLTIATVNAIAQWYPQVTSGFFIAGGLGLGTMRTEIDFGGLGTLSSNTTALGYQVGVGYDLRLGRNVSLTPYSTFFGTAGGKVEDTDVKLDANVVQFGLGLTFH